MRGVERVIVGYTGGKQPHPKYGNLQDHTEALLLDFNPKEVSYWEILEMWNDNANPWKRDSIQYRSAIFWTSLSQQDEALQFLQRLSASNPKKDCASMSNSPEHFIKRNPIIKITLPDDNNPLRKSPVFLACVSQYGRNEKINKTNLLAFLAIVQE